MKTLKLVLILGMVLGLAAGLLMRDTGPVGADDVGDLVAWWNFNDGGGATADDSAHVGPTLDGAITGATFMAGGPAVPSNTHYLNFAPNGGADFVTVLNHPSLEAADVSISAWVRSADPGGASNAYIVAQGAKGCTSPTYALYAPSGTNLAFLVYDGTNFAATPLALAAAVWDSGWHHVAGTFDSGLGAAKLYLDGGLVGTVTPVGFAGLDYSLSTHKDLTIGSYQGSCSLPYTGDIDQVLIYDRVLTPAQITTLATTTGGLSSPFTVDDDGLGGSCSGDLPIVFSSIQDAIDVASASETINVCPGDYDEQLTVDVSGLTLTGDPGDTCTDTDDPDLGPDVDAPNVDPSVGPSSTFDVDITATDVTIEGFNFDFNGDGSRAGLGILVRTTGVSILDNDIEVGKDTGATDDGIGVTTVSGGDAGLLLVSCNSFVSADAPGSFGVWINDGGTTGVRIEISDNTIGSDWLGGVAVNRNLVDVLDNDMDGPGPALGTFGVHVGSDSGTDDLDDIVIDGNEITAFGTAVDVFKTDAGDLEVTINDNLLEDSGEGIFGGDGSTLTITMNDIDGNGTGILIDGTSTGNTISDNKVQFIEDSFAAGDGNGIELKGTGTSDVGPDNDVHDNEGHGILVESAGNNIHDNNGGFHDNGGHGIFLEVGADGNTVEENTTNENTDTGIQVNGDTNIIGPGNTANENGNNGIRVGQSGNGNEVHNNTTEENDHNGLRINGSGNDVHDNTTRLNVDYGILVDGDPNGDNNEIGPGNTASLNEKDGIHLLDGADGNHVHDNIANTNGTSPGNGITVSGDDNEIGPGNDASFNTLNGIHLTETAEGNVVHDNNTVENGTSPGDGILVDGDGNTVGPLNTIAMNDDHGVHVTGDDNVIIGNEITDNDGGGVTISGSATGNTVTGNTINENTGDGVYIGGTPEDNLIAGNTIEDNTGDGVHLTADGNDVVGNTLKGNQTGVNVYSSGNLIINNLAKKNEEDGYYIGGDDNILISNEGIGNDDNGFEVGGPVDPSGNVFVANAGRQNDGFGFFDDSTGGGGPGGVRNIYILNLCGGPHHKLPIKKPDHLDNGSGGSSPAGLCLDTEGNAGS